MSAALAFDVLLCLLLAGTALLAVAGRDLFASIAFFITYGILIGLAWLRLGAVDVALAEVAIGAGLTGVLLIGAWSAIRRRRGDGPSAASRRGAATAPGAARHGDGAGATAVAPAAQRRAGRGSGLGPVASQGGGEADDPAVPAVARWGAALACLALTALLVAAVLSLPAAQPGLRPAVEANLAASGVGNPVTAVLLNFRAYDTLMESVVLLIALVAVWALTPKGGWGGEPGLRQHARPDGVLATFGRLLPPAGMLVALYLVWAGGDQPGGAFQGGTVLAAVWLLVVMAGLAREPRVASRALRAALVVGPGVFLAVGLAGAAFGVFLGLPEAHAKTLILLIEFALTFSIAVTLALLVAGVPRAGGEP